MSKNTIELSIVVPFFNEEEVLPEFHKRISTVVKKIGVCFEIVYVNDLAIEDYYKKTFRKKP